MHMSTMHQPIRETHIVGAGTREWTTPHRADVRSDAGVRLFGLADACPEFSFVRHNPPFAMLLTCFSGKGYVSIKGQWKACTPGSAYVTPPGVMHAYHAAPNSRWGVCWVQYDSRPRCPISTPEPLLIRLDPRPLRAIIGGLYRESVTRSEPRFLQSWVELLQLYVARALRNAPSADPLWTLWNAVASDLARPWSVPDLAALAAMSGEHLRRLCRRQLGCAPMQQVARLRMNHAAIMLRATPEKIVSIAHAVGYANRFAFSAAFARCFGQSPGDYRLEQPPASAPQDPPDASLVTRL
jgi:AraC-like DNA-binding protein